jgi:hypothetical protein
LKIEGEIIKKISDYNTNKTSIEFKDILIIGNPGSSSELNIRSNYLKTN